MKPYCKSDRGRSAISIIHIAGVAYETTSTAKVTYFLVNGNPSEAWDGGSARVTREHTNAT